MTPSPLPNNPAPPMPIQPDGVSTSTGNPVLDEISAAHASLSPQAQQAIEGAHGMLGISPAHSDPALAASAAPSPAVAVPGVSGPRGPLPNLSPEVPARPSVATPKIESPPADPMVPGMVGVRASDIAPGPNDDLPLSSSPPAALNTEMPPTPGASASPPMPINPHQVEFERLTKPPLNPSENASAHTSADSGRPGYEQIHNPWLRGLATFGNVIASGVFPRFGQFIPGTSGYHNNLVANEKGALGEEQAGAKSAADVAKTEADTKTLEAQVPHIEAETAALGNPKDEFALFHQQNPKGTVTDFVKQQESGKNPTSPYQIWSREPANAGKGYMDFLKAETATRPPANELELYVKTHPDEANPLAGYEQEKQNITSKPLTKETADALNANYNTLAKQYKGIPADQFHEGMTSAEATQIKAAMLGAIAGTQKGQNITINQSKADTAAATKRDAETSKEFVRVNKRLTTGYDKLQGQMDNLDAADKEISGTAPAQALGIIKSIVATAGGQGSGVRITQAELNSLTKARNLGDSFEAWIQKFGSGKSLAPEQVSEIRDMLSGIRETANTKHQQYLDSLDRLNGARSVQDVRQIESEFNHAQSGDSGTARKITSKADYDALPKDASYVDSDGKTYTKK